MDHRRSLRPELPAAGRARTASPPALMALLGLALLLSAGGRAGAQTPPSTRARLNDLEDRVQELEAEVEREREAREAAEKAFSRGIITLGGLRFRLGGQIKINFEDPQSEKSPLFGSTESPDPHFELERLRLSPRIDFTGGKPLLGNVYARGQIDFHPTSGDTILREATLDHVVSPVWWLKSHLKFGLDDRFIHPHRLTQSYPLIGNAFWRRESVALFWEGTLGQKRGAPAEGRRRPRRAAGRQEPEAEEGEESGGPAGAEEEMELHRGGAMAEEESDEVGQPVPSRSSRTRSTRHAPFDFAGNPGALKLHLSIGDGYRFNDELVGKDGARFDRLLIDDRNFDTPLSLREVGLGLGYQRDFRELGEVDLLGFYYDDELSDQNLSFLQTNLTERDPVTLAAIRGFGDSELRHSNRFGVSGGYHLESYHFLRRVGLLDNLNPRRGDGLYLFYQWIAAQDGDLDRQGWYAQASFRVSNPNRRWRYFRSLEPVVRYGELVVDQAHIPSLPLTWSRRQWLAGAVLEVVRSVYLRTEYTWNDEATGGGKVANNELLVQLLVLF